jgi:hypothetical protein
MGITGHADLSERFLLPGERTSYGHSLFTEQKVADLVAAEHTDFIEAIQTGRSPAVSGTEARRSLALVEACYAERHLWELPWVEPCPTKVRNPSKAEADLADQRTALARRRPAMEAG